jgi:hypothetical protein
MTTHTSTPSTTTTNRFGMRAAVLIATVGPLSIAALRGLLPYDTVDDPATITAQVAAHPVAESAALWLSYLALLTMPLAVLVVSRVAMRARPVLGTVAAVLAWVGFAGLTFLITPDLVAVAAADAGLPTATTATLLTAINGNAVSSTATLLFVAGHILGTVLLGLALWRVIPRWAAVLLIVSQPLHFVVAVIVPNHPLDTLAWLLTTIGFAVAAVAGQSPTVRMPAAS